MARAMSKGRFPGDGPGSVFRLPLGFLASVMAAHRKKVALGPSLLNLQ
jgi:hypothetical protein